MSALGRSLNWLPGNTAPTPHAAFCSVGPGGATGPAGGGPGGTSGGSTASAAPARVPLRRGTGPPPRMPSSASWDAQSSIDAENPQRQRDQRRGTQVVRIGEQCPCPRGRAVPSGRLPRAAANTTVTVSSAPKPASGCWLATALGQHPAQRRRGRVAGIANAARSTAVSGR